MNAQGIIREVQESAQEYIEMAENPWEFISWVLAERLAQKTSQAEFQERIIDALNRDNRCRSNPGVTRMVGVTSMENH
jgi:hypothetical protein